MKKIILIIVIVILSLFLYKNFNAKDNKNELTFWSIQLKPVYEAQMRGIIKEFESKHPFYKVKWIDIPINEAQKRTLASILSSTPPDLINLNPGFSLLLAQKDTLETFDNKDLSQFSEKLLDKLKYDNKIYALPFYATSAVTIYNKETWDNCFGGEFITTYDELFSLAPTLAQCSNIPVYVNSLNENDTLAKILAKYDITYFETEEEKENAKYVFDEFNKMYKNNQMPKDTLAISHREVIEKYMSNQASIIVAGSNFLNMIKKSAPDIYEKSDISYQLTGLNGEYDISLMNLIIPKRAKNKELAFEFALLLTNQKNQEEFAKLTNVLPANKYALEDDYFKNCSSDLYDKSRCISAWQLNNISEADFGEKNRSSINEAINKTFEEILLKDDSSSENIELKIDNLSQQIKKLREN